MGPLHGSVPLPMCPVWLISGRVGKSACFWPPGPTPEQPWVPGHILSYLGLYTPSKGTPRQLCGWEAPMAPGPVLPRPAGSSGGGLDLPTALSSGAPACPVRGLGSELPGKKPAQAMAIPDCGWGGTHLPQWLWEAGPRQDSWVASPGSPEQGQLLLRFDFFPRSPGSGVGVRVRGTAVKQVQKQAWAPCGPPTLTGSQCHCLSPHSAPPPVAWAPSGGPCAAAPAERRTAPLLAGPSLRAAATCGPAPCGTRAAGVRCVH